VHGNTLNTIYALGHNPLFKESTIQAYKTPTTASNNDFHFNFVFNELSNEHGYTTAVSKFLTKDNSLKFNELEQCINSAKVPMLIVLNINYSGDQFRRHLIGIVPSVVIGNKTEKHIVDRYNTNLKSFPLNEENLRWCCSGCISFFVEQFV
jgi:hypothetical protein